MEQLSGNGELGGRAGLALYQLDIIAVFKQREEAIRHYKQFVADGEGQPSAWEELKNQVYLGDDDFVAEMQKKLGVIRT